MLDMTGNLSKYDDKQFVAVGTKLLASHTRIEKNQLQQAREWPREGNDERDYYNQ